MKVGFTGTQEGMQTWQSQFVFDEAMDLQADEYHHGCCVGADEEFDTMIGAYCASGIIVGHPPTNTSKMAVDLYCDEMREPKEYLVRNRDIVDETDWLIAAPKGPEERRSGTWSTIRYARKLGRPVSIVWPDGTVTRERVPEIHQMTAVLPSNDGP